MANIYIIYGWQPLEAPHWHYAAVEAADPREAKDRLLHLLETERPEEARDWTDPAAWTVELADRPFIFALGGGCR